MAAPPGNNFAEKFKTSEERQALCEAWCNWISEGRAKEGFPLCDPQTFRVYCEKYPKDFDTEKIGAAERANFAWWEEESRKMMWMGSKSTNASILIFNFKNRFKWRDQVDVTSDGKRLDTLNGLLGSIATTKPGEDPGTSSSD
jgi:hypothetical protein